MIFVLFSSISCVMVINNILAYPKKNDKEELKNKKIYSKIKCERKIKLSSLFVPLLVKFRICFNLSCECALLLLIELTTCNN